jgi:hypothetical protein
MTDDHIAGDIGQEGDGVIVGKGVQSVRVDLGDRSPAEAAEILRQLNRAVFGDGLGWDGVVQQLRQIRRDVEELTENVVTLKQEVTTLKQQMQERTETSQQMQRLLTLIAVGVGVLVVFAVWAFIVSLGV